MNEMKEEKNSIADTKTSGQFGFLPKTQGIPALGSFASF